MRISDWSSDVCSSDLHHLLWASRSMIPEAQAWITDICVPISRLADAISRAQTMIEESGLFAPILGHVGDGNFHVFFILHPDDKLSWQKADRKSKRLNSSH